MAKITKQTAKALRELQDKRTYIRTLVQRRAKPAVFWRHIAAVDFTVRP